ncbi:MAG: S-layer homology domain-containing protein, partial [Chloroflexota bacterium]|nr:S-layer homology domain-containing protein [Chloroflexota bacterium]
AGIFGGSSANVSATVDTGSLSGGRHLLLVQGMSDAGNWGILSGTFFTVTGSIRTSTPTSLTLSTPTATSSAPPMLPTSTATLPAVIQVTPTSTPPASPTSTASASPSQTSTASPTPSITPIPEANNTPPPTRTATATATLTATVTATHTPTNTRTATDTPTPTDTRTATGTPTSTGTHTATNTRTATSTPTNTRTFTPTRTPEPADTATALPCADYSDVHPSQYFYKPVDWLTCRQIVSGYPDGTFRPNNPATRAQIIKLVTLGEKWDLYSPAESTFTDVLPGDWSYSYVETAVLHRVISGYADGTFRPNDNVTRGQLSKIIVLASGWALLDRVQPHFLDVPAGSTFYVFIETAQEHGVVSGYGDGTFKPSEQATRGQLSKMLYVALTQSGGP